MIDHRRAWPLTNEEAYRSGVEEPRFGSWRNADPVLRQLEEFMNTRWGNCVEYNGRENVAGLFTGKKSMFGAVAYMATATSITTSTGPLATIVGQMGIMRCWDIRPEGEMMLNRMNDVLRGRN